MAQRTVVLECNRLNSIDVPNGLANASKDNATFKNANWTNVFAPIRLNKGDTVSLQNCIINEVGANTNSIELSGEQVKGKEYTDNNVLFEMTYYLTHNAINSCGLPFCITTGLERQLSAPEQPPLAADALVRCLPETINSTFNSPWYSEQDGRLLPGNLFGISQSKITQVQAPAPPTGVQPPQYVAFESFSMDNIRCYNRFCKTDSARYTKMHPKFFPWKTSTGEHFYQHLGYTPSVAPNTNYILVHLRNTTDIEIGDYLFYPPNTGVGVIVTNKIESVFVAAAGVLPAQPTGIRPLNEFSKPAKSLNQDRTIFKIICGAVIPSNPAADLPPGATIQVIKAAAMADPNRGNLVSADETYFKMFSNISQHLFTETFQDPSTIASRITLDFHRTQASTEFDITDRETNSIITAPSVMRGYYDVITNLPDTQNLNTYQHPLYRFNKTSVISIGANGVNMDKVPSTPLETLGSTGTGELVVSPPDVFDTELEIYPQICVREPKRVIGGAFLNNCDVYNLTLDDDLNPQSARGSGGAVVDGYRCVAPVLIARYISPAGLGNFPAPYFRVGRGATAPHPLMHGGAIGTISYLDGPRFLYENPGANPPNYSGGGQPFFTNIQFNEINLQRVKHFLLDTEEYIGNKTTDEEAQRDEWFLSRQGISKGGAATWQTKCAFGRTTETAKSVPPVPATDRYDIGGQSARVPLWAASVLNPGAAGIANLHETFLCPTMDGRHDGTGFQEDRELGNGTLYIRSRYDPLFITRTQEAIFRTDRQPAYPANQLWTPDPNYIRFYDEPTSPADAIFEWKSLLEKYGIAFYPYKYYPQGDAPGGAAQILGYFVYNSQGIDLGNQVSFLTTPLDTEQRNCNILWGNYIGCSPSFFDQPTILPINRDTQLDITQLTAGAGGDINCLFTTNYLNIGATDMAINFESELSRYSISNLHTARQCGFLDAEGHDPASGTPTSEIGEKIAIINEIIDQPQGAIENGVVAAAGIPEEPGVCWVFNSQALTGRFKGCLNDMSYIAAQTRTPGLPGFPAYDIYNTNQNSLREVNENISDSLSGIFIENIYFANPGYTNSRTDFTQQSNINNLLIKASYNEWNGSLLFRMGFEYHDFFPHFSFYNGRSFRLNSLTYNNRTDKRVGTKPLTTNGNITMSAITSLNLVLKNRTFMSSDPRPLAPPTWVPAGGGLVTGAAVDWKTVEGDFPNFQLGYPTLNQTNIQGAPTDSAIMSAANLIRRAANSFYKIYCDLPGPQYIAGDEQSDLTCIGIALKSYAANDFFYSYNPGYTIRIDNDMVLSSIRTAIRDANGRPARISSASCVMYQIVKSYSPPQEPAENVSLTDKLLISLIELIGTQGGKKLKPSLNAFIENALGISPPPPAGDPPGAVIGGGGGGRGVSLQSYAADAINPPRSSANPLIMGSNVAAGGNVNDLGLGDNEGSPLIQMIIRGFLNAGVMPPPQFLQDLPAQAEQDFMNRQLNFEQNMGQLLSAPINAVELSPYTNPHFIHPAASYSEAVPNLLQNFERGMAYLQKQLNRVETRIGDARTDGQRIALENQARVLTDRLNDQLAAYNEFMRMTDASAIGQEYKPGREGDDEGDADFDAGPPEAIGAFAPGSLPSIPAPADPQGDVAYNAPDDATREEGAQLLRSMGLDQGAEFGSVVGEGRQYVKELRGNINLMAKGFNTRKPSTQSIDTASDVGPGGKEGRGMAELRRTQRINVQTDKHGRVLLGPGRDATVERGGDREALVKWGVKEIGAGGQLPDEMLRARISQGDVAVAGHHGRLEAHPLMPNSQWEDPLYAGNPTRSDFGKKKVDRSGPRDRGANVKPYGEVVRSANEARASARRQREAAARSEGGASASKDTK